MNSSKNYLFCIC